MLEWTFEKGNDETVPDSWTAADDRFRIIKHAEDEECTCPRDYRDDVHYVLNVLIDDSSEKRYYRFTVEMAKRKAERLSNDGEVQR